MPVVVHGQFPGIEITTGSLPISRSRNCDDFVRGTEISTDQRGSRRIIPTWTRPDIVSADYRRRFGTYRADFTNLLSALKEL